MRGMGLRYSVTGLFAAASFAAVGCAGGGALGPAGPEVAISVAPLNLDGVGNARYTVTVLNGVDEVVWSRVIEADQFGDGAGSVSYVGPCDADASDNTVQLVVEALYDSQGGLIPASTWTNPTASGPLSKDFTCLADRDVAVGFDLTLARAAQQGFFDVAVELDDVFCSAKLDCGATTDVADDLLLLHDGGVRSTTAVLGLACTAGPSSDTYLYLNSVIIECAGGSGNPTVVDVSQLGNVADLDAAPNANPDNYLFGAAVYRGDEGLAGKSYWNVALGLNRDSFGVLGECRIRATATATATPLTDGQTPDASAYPYIDWDVALSDAGGRVCTEHAVDDGSGVTTRYASASAPETFEFEYNSAAGITQQGGGGGPSLVCDDFDGSSLDPRWVLVQGTLPTYTVSGSALVVTNADYVASLSLANFAGIVDRLLDRGNQIAWPQTIGPAGDFDITVDMGWSSAEGELTYGSIALTDADNYIKIEVGFSDNSSVAGSGPGAPFARTGPSGPDAWTGPTPASISGSAVFRVARAGGMLSIWHAGDLVAGPVANTEDIANIAFVYQRRGWLVPSNVRPYGTVTLNSVGYGCP